MGLVDYSESEGSEDETQNTQVQARITIDANPSTTSKPSFQKKIDKANPRKIKVDLPNPSNGVETASREDTEGPPAKRARTGGGFNSFLPAPKNPNKPAPSSDGSRGLLSGGGGVGRGVSLKTGSQPAFSRAPASPRAEVEPDEFRSEASPAPAPATDLEEPDTSVSQSHIQPDAQPAVRKPMFKPLSVRRKPDKKRKKPPLANGSESTAKAASNGLPAVQSDVAPDRSSLPTAPKRSLFASAQEEPEQAAEETSNGTYQPYLEDTADIEAQPETPASKIQAATSTNQPAQNLDALASSLNLTPSQRRQLFGRSGVPTAAQLQQFSVSQEYASNAAAAAEGEANAAAAPKTVKSIAPGKHSLQQLLNQASTQKEALEESFARGKSNKKEGASRYGWG